MTFFRDKAKLISDAAVKIFFANGGFIFLFFLFNVLTLSWSLLNEDKVDVFIGYAFSVLFASFLLAAVLSLIRIPRLLKVVKALIILVFFVPFFVETFVMYNYKALIGTGIMNALMETNLRESVEFLKMYVGFTEISFVLLLCVAAVLLVKYRPWKRIKVRDGAKYKTAVFLIVFSALQTIRMFAMYPYFMFDDKLLPIQRTCSASQAAYKNIQAYHELTAEMSNKKIELTENNSKIKNIVFILGESTNRNHMHLYGYDIPNTPHLDEYADKGEICVFRDVVSPHSTTIAVLSKLFTFCHHESDKEWYEYNNLIDVMNAAGYKTHWLSNQESSGIWGNVAQIYADHSTMHKFTRIRDSREDEGILDEELFPLVDEAIANRSPDKNFYVVHLMGGHGLYYNRFPYSFYKFKPEDIKMNVTEGQKQVIAEYDDALYYNDYVVSNIIERFRDEETLVIYVPDHGEAVYDEGAGFTGHIEENPSRHMIEIPMIIWASPKFKEKYPDKWAAIQKAVNRPYMTDDMIHTILDLADIKTEEYDPTRSIVNALFDASRPRIFNDLDYDTQIKNGVQAQ